MKDGSLQYVILKLKHEEVWFLEKKLKDLE